VVCQGGEVGLQPYTANDLVTRIATCSA